MREHVERQLGYSAVGRLDRFFKPRTDCEEETSSKRFDGKVYDDRWIGEKTNGKRSIDADKVSDVMVNKAIDSTSGCQLRSDEEAAMQQQSNETFSISSCADVGTRQSLERFRTIDSWQFDGSVYIGEGNATLVVSLPHERKVVRFRKSDENSGDTSDGDGGKMRTELSVNFFENVISGLMGRYANEPEIVRCDPNNVARLMSLLETQRPEYRRRKKVLNTYATALPDYTLLPGYLHDKLPLGKNSPTFCVEIKPKQGFVDERVSLLRGKCDYCRKQSSKFSEGKITSPSKYCPCDLFSGETSRMRRAVRGLIDSSQNNFRIFRNGRLVWGEGFEREQLDNVLAEWFSKEQPFDSESARETLFRIIHEALLRPFPKNFPNRPSTIAGNVTEETAATLSLPENSVLATILRVQKINKHSVDFVYGIYSRYSSILTDEMIYLDKQLELPECENSHESNLMPSTEEFTALRNYLLSRLARDCSILMAFQRIESSEISAVPTDNVIQISNSRCFAFHNAVTDLDPKSVHSIPKHHHRRTAEIVKVANEGQRAHRPNPSDTTK